MSVKQDEDIFIRNSSWWLYDKAEERFFKYRDLDIGALLYYLLNALPLIVRFYYHSWGSKYLAVCIAVAAVVYEIITLILHKTRIGDILMCASLGCYKFSKSNPETERVNRLFANVIRRVNRLQDEWEHIPDNMLTVKYQYNTAGIWLVENDSMSACVYTLSPTVICITKGMLQKPDIQIEAMIGRAIAETMWSVARERQIVFESNIFVLVWCCILKMVKNPLSNIVRTLYHGDDKKVKQFINLLPDTIERVLIGIPIHLWAWIGCGLKLEHSYTEACQCDEYACALGYRDVLTEFLETTDFKDGADGAFWELAKMQPENQNLRIDYINDRVKK